MAEARAPGKLVVCGEYAVLHGAPAIAVAVDVTAVARVSPAAAGRLVVAGAGSWPLRWDAAGQPQWTAAAPGDAGRILEAVAATLAAAGRPLARPLEISLDTRAFQSQPRPGGIPEKLGLGSSAAITVALLRALPGADAGDTDGLFRLGLEAHRRFQLGAGSGIDIAAAVYGGVVALGGAAGALPRRLSWPAGLHWLAAWSGRGAATTALLARLDAFRARQPAAFARRMGELCAAAEAALAEWETGGAARILSALQACRDRLEVLDAEAGIGVLTAAHRALAREAAARGALYKTSGAGGGDFGLAFSASAEAIARLAADYAGRGVTTLPGRADVGGARLVG